MVLDGVPYSLRMLLIVPVIALQQGLNLGAGFFVARLGARYSDVREILPHFFRIMLYISGVIFSVEDRVQNATLRGPCSRCCPSTISSRWPAGR